MKKTFKRLSALLLALAMAFALASCGGDTKPSSAPTKEPSQAAGDSAAPTAGTDNKDLPVLRVSLHPAYISTPVAYAIFNDMAKDYGFQMDVQVYASGAPQNEALGSGLWDVGVIGGAFVTSVNTYNAYVIGDFIDGREGNAIFVRADSDIAKATGSNPTYPDILGSADTVRGKTLITNLGTTGHVQVQKWLEALGLTEDDIKIVQMDYAAGYQAFISGEGDILATIGPYSTKALIEHAEDWVVAGGFISLDLMQYEDVVCSADALENKRDLLVSFLRMVMDANDILAKDFELHVSTYSKWMTENGKEVDEAEARMECTQKPLMTSEQIQELINGNFGEYEKMVWEMSIEAGSIGADTISKLDSNVIPDLMREALAR